MSNAQQTKRYVLTIEGEGEQPEAIEALSTKDAKAKAASLIWDGDYGLAEGESIRVRYYLVCGEERIDASVEVQG